MTPGRVDTVFCALFGILLFAAIATLGICLTQIVRDGARPYSDWPDSTYVVRVTTPGGEVHSEDEVTVVREVLRAPRAKGWRQNAEDD